MEIIFILIPLSLLLLGAAIWAFFWATKSGQFDDMDSPALSILDDDEPEGTSAGSRSDNAPSSAPGNAQRD